jgi:hypothetical protein
MYEQAGRDASALRVVPLGSIPEAGKLEYLRGLGITEIVLNLPSADRDTVLQVLDDHAKIVEPFRS